MSASLTSLGPDVTVVSVAGEVDIATVQAFAQVLRGAVDGGEGGRVVVEVNRVTFLGACALTVIIDVHEEASRSGREVVLVVDEVAPAAVSLRFLPEGRGPARYSTLTAACRSGRP